MQKYGFDWKKTVPVRNEGKCGIYVERSGKTENAMDPEVRRLGWQVRLSAVSRLVGT